MKPYVLVLDHGTTGIKVCLINREGEILSCGYEKVPSIYPQPGWVEQDAMQLWQLTRTAIARAFAEAKASWKDVACIGMTNQRETTVLWDKATGLPVHHAIVWQCRRTSGWCEQQKEDQGLVEELQQRTGLVLDAYFSASKIRWLLEHCPEAKRLLQNGQLRFGTIDSWILWMLTGQQVHATDLTNASRTMLFNLRTRVWDSELLGIFGVPEDILPEVKPSSGFFGWVDPQLTDGFEIPVLSMIGDQQAALYGQRCWEPGSCKNTFGTGAFLMMNLGERYLLSDRGLLTTLACDAAGNPVYALEGALFIAGAAMEWLKNELGIIRSFEEGDELAHALESNEGVYLVPAFVGLGAPYWRSDVRGSITGLTQGAGKAHFARAALESMAYQSDDVVQLMLNTASVPLSALRVDGGVTRSDFLMQFLADLLDVPVCRMEDAELTAKGAGYLAGLAGGFWQSSLEIAALPEKNRLFHPSMSNEKRRLYRQGWHRAVDQLLASEPLLSSEKEKMHQS